jgi:hypothetical protein
MGKLPGKVFDLKILDEYQGHEPVTVHCTAERHQMQLADASCIAAQQSLASIAAELCSNVQFVSGCSTHTCKSNRSKICAQLLPLMW